MISLSSLWLYPIKGARGTSVASAEVGDRGLVGDRRYMVVDPEGGQITQREVAKLALVVPALEPDGLSIDAPGMPTLRVGREGERRTVTVWSSSVEAFDVGAGAWFSEVLGRSCGLVYMPDTARRPVNPKYDDSGAIVSFADGFPFLLANEASLADLNGRLDAPLPMNRFRPNLVVRGAEAWAEDHWDRVQIGAIQFSVPKPCDRCVVTTIDQSTAIAGKEPLRTMATFRSRDGKVWFGENLVHHAQGTLTVGDAITVL